jgi:hypothetical protein
LRRADELIEKFLDSIGGANGSVYVDLFKSWRKVAGDRIADHARPIDIKGSSLVVETDHPGWSQMVIMNRSRILTQLSRQFPDLNLTGIIVHLASDLRKNTQQAPAELREKTPPPPPRPPSASEKEALEKIEDSELRGVLDRLRDEIAQNDGDT